MIAYRAWVIDPHSGGRPISESLQETISDRLHLHAENNYKEKYQKPDISFRKQFCYLGFFRPIPPRTYKPYKMTFEDYLEHIATHPIKMARLRYFDIERWSCAFYTYSNETYRPCLLHSGEWCGSIEQCFDVGAAHFE
jgi:hypothetical protein